MHKYFLIGLLALAMCALVPGAAFAVGTSSGTIVSHGGDANANASYATPTDAAGELVVAYKSGTGGYVEASNITTRTVAAVYGWAIPTGEPYFNTTSGKNGGNAGVVTSFTWVVRNWGNTSEEADLTISSQTYGGGAANWASAIKTLGGTTVATTEYLAEDAYSSFKVELTPSTTAGEADNGSRCTIEVTVASANGAGFTAYVGDNAKYYGQSASNNDQEVGGTITDVTWLEITGPTISITSQIASITTGKGSATVTDIQPGSEIRYMIVVTNSGGAAAANVVVHNQIPADTTLAYSGSGTDQGGADTNGMYTAFGGAQLETNLGDYDSVGIADQATAETVTWVRFVLGSLPATSAAICYVRVDVQ